MMNKTTPRQVAFVLLVGTLGAIALAVAIFTQLVGGDPVR